MMVHSMYIECEVSKKGSPSTSSKFMIPLEEKKSKSFLVAFAKYTVYDNNL